MVTTDTTEEIMCFTGEITEDTLSDLLPELEEKLQGQPLSKRKKVVNVFVELIQNQFHYFCAEDDLEGFPYYVRCFYDQTDIVLETKNIVRIGHKEYLESIIDCVNTLSKEGLIQKYRDQLASQKIDSKEKGAGLGLMDIVRKSGEKLLCSFEKYDSGHEYFIVRATVK